MPGPNGEWCEACYWWEKSHTTDTFAPCVYESPAAGQPVVYGLGRCSHYENREERLQALKRLKTVNERMEKFVESLVGGKQDGSQSEDGSN